MSFNNDNELVSALAGKNKEELQLILEIMKLKKEANSGGEKKASENVLLENKEKSEKLSNQNEKISSDEISGIGNQKRLVRDVESSNRKNLTCKSESFNPEGSFINSSVSSKVSVKMSESQLNEYQEFLNFKNAKKKESILTQKETEEIPQNLLSELDPPINQQKSFAKPQTEVSVADETQQKVILSTSETKQKPSEESDFADWRNQDSSSDDTLGAILPELNESKTEDKSELNVLMNELGSTTLTEQQPRIIAENQEAPRRERDLPSLNNPFESTLCQEDSFTPQEKHESRVDQLSAQAPPNDFSKKESSRVLEQLSNEEDMQASQQNEEPRIKSKNTSSCEDSSKTSSKDPSYVVYDNFNWDDGDDDGDDRKGFSNKKRQNNNNNYYEQSNRSMQNSSQRNSGYKNPRYGGQRSSNYSRPQNNSRMFSRGIVDGHSCPREYFKSIVKEFETFSKERKQFLASLPKDCNTMKPKMRKSIEDKYFEKLQEYEYQESNQEENVLTQHRNYSHYIQKKIENHKKSYEVFSEFQDNKKGTFRFNFLRVLNLQQFTFGLPIYTKKASFYRAFNKNEVIIFKSTTGSGKSTQLPQYLLDCCQGPILVVEPRAIAAENVARRVRDELGEVSEEARDMVGWVVGNKRTFNPEKAQIVYITEHEFKKQLINDKKDFLDAFETFVIDEAHELKKIGMIILAVLKNHLKKTGDRHRLVITSATLNAAVFKRYFENDLRVAELEASTPTFDVEIHYSKFPDLESSLRENTVNHLKVIFDHIRRNFRCEDTLPNVLVFMPSVRDIKEMVKFIEEDPMEIFKQVRDELPLNIEELHGALRPKEKQEVIEAPAQLKKTVRVILASKIAETAITLQDIFYVLDSGLEREYFYDEVTKLSYMQETKISKSSAEQRKGRAGRVGDGFCFKMYNEEEELKFRETKIPEILRMDIADVILIQTELNSLFKMDDLLFSEELDKSKISCIQKELYQLRAIQISNQANQQAELTLKGKFMMRMAASTPISAFLFECRELGCLELGIIAASCIDNLKSIFRNKDSLKTYSKKEVFPQMVDTEFKKELEQLGDLAPFISIYYKYNNSSESEKRRFHDTYEISEEEIKLFFQKKMEMQM